jgi:Na+/citrate or Na+/malate symporter
MRLTRLFTGLVKVTGLLIAIRFGLLEGLILGGHPDAQMLLVAAFMMSGAQGVDALAGVIIGMVKK